MRMTFSYEVARLNIHPSIPAARAKIPTRAVAKVQRILNGLSLEKKGDSIGVQGEVEGDQEGRQGVFPGLHGGLVGVPPGEGRGGKGESAVGGETSDRME